MQPTQSLILVLDFGSQYTQLIARRLREIGVYTEIVPYFESLDSIKAKAPRGIILSGGPASVYEKDAYKPDSGIFNLCIPILGICYGMQYIADFFGGEVAAAKAQEFGKAHLHIIESPADSQPKSQPHTKTESPALFANVKQDSIVWMSHADKVMRLPEGFVELASSGNTHYCVIADFSRKIYAMQFHPEVVHSECGSKILQNFAVGICQCNADWNMKNFAQNEIKKLRQIVLGKEADSNADFIESSSDLREQNTKSSKDSIRQTNVHSAVSLRDFRSCEAATRGSYLEGNDRSGAANSLKITKETTSHLRRCDWANDKDPILKQLYEAYHDNEWGVPLHDDKKLFEMLILEGFQAGLSWITILKRRETFRAAFDDFDARKIATYDEAKIELLMQNSGIIRNRLKIEATITNAKAFLAVQEAFGSFAKYIWGFVDSKPIINHFATMEELPAKTALSDKISKDLQKRGFKFVGSTIVYAFMQAIGMVDDHLESCFKRAGMVKIEQHNIEIITFAQLCQELGDTLNTEAALNVLLEIWEDAIKGQISEANLIIRKEEIRQDFLSQATQIFIAKNDNKYYKKYLGFIATKEAQILLLFVRGINAKKGIGKALLHTALHYPLKSFDEIYLDSREAALSFYTHLGFRQSGEAFESGRTNVRLIPLKAQRKVLFHKTALDSQIQRKSSKDSHSPNLSQNLPPQSSSQTKQSLQTPSKVLCAVSGGVDSSVVATLLYRAIGENLIPVFVDTGLLRKGEREAVEAMFRENLKVPLIVVDASELFLSRLKDITDPEKKRKIIGESFIEVFEAEAKKHNTHGEIKFLAQGTLYPDVIESVSVKGPSKTIKSHHNVGGLPEWMKFELIEPLRELFKDEVRALGRELGMPESMLMRHPFPGPGLAIRIMGAVNKADLALLREADSILIEELHKTGLYNKVWQAFCVLLNVRSVGVMGDNRTYDNTICVRAVEAQDGMTASFSHLPHTFLESLSNRIINEVKGINRVVYDITSKPPGTIEWE